MKKIVSLLLLCLFFTPLKAAESNANTAKEIPVAAIFSLTGRGANSNLRHVLGIKLAAKQINESGGILGRPLKIIWIDNKSSVIGSVEAAQEAVKQNVVAILGASWSAHSLAIAPIAQKAHIPMISNYSSNIQLTEVGNYIFRVCYVDDFQAAIMAQFARQNLGFTHVAILYQSGDEYSKGLANFFKANFENLGGTVVVYEPYLRDSLDFKEQLSKIKNAPVKIQGVYIPGYEKEPGLIIRQMYNMTINLPVLGADSWGDRLSDYVGGNIYEGYETRPWHESNTSPVSQAFVKAFYKEFPEEKEILSGTALAYDATKLLADAMTRALSTKPNDVRKSLQSTQTFVGVTGPIRFNEKRNPIKGGVIKRYMNSKRPEYFFTVQP